LDLTNLRRDQAKHAARAGNGEQAVAYARHALESAGEENPHERGNALWALAEGLALTEEADEADTAFREATKLLEEHGHRRDVVVQLRAPDDRGIDELSFVLALDDDHSEFLERFRDDPLLRRALPRLRGYRPLRLSTVTHALLRAVCGQLIQASRARQIERNVIRATTSRLPAAWLHTPPTPASF